MKYDLKDNCLDIFRLIAAVNVMLVHGVNWLSVNVSNEMKWLKGSLGVPILYLLCGYFTYASFDKIKNNKGGVIKSFYFNRFIRIYPPIWISILILVLVNCIFGQNILNPNYICITLAEIILPRGGEEGIEGYITNGSLWTMPIELQFYLLFPIFYKILKKLKRDSFKLLIMILIIFNIIVYRIDDFVINLPLPQVFYVLYNMLIFPYLYVFLIGCYIYKYRDNIFEIICKTKVLVIMGALFCIWRIIYTYNPFIHFGKLYNPITTLILAIIVFGIGYKVKLRLKIDLSYGIYIYHMIIINTLLKIGETGFKALCLMIICSLLMAILSYCLVEKPMKKVKRI